MSNESWGPSDQFPQPPDDDVEFIEVLRALADATRLKIVATLADGLLHPCRVEEYGLAIQKSTLSHHFKVLRESGLTSTRVRGREAAVELRHAMLDARFPGLVGAIQAGAHV